MPLPLRVLRTALPVAFLCCSLSQWAAADTYTNSGTFTSDDQVFEYDFTVPNAQTYTFYTTSYGGGANLDGTVSMSGGFVPVLSLFSVASGNSVGFDGGGGSALGCRGGAVADAGTGMCDDAYLQLALASGSYKLFLSEFPNVTNGTASDPMFQFAGAGDFTAGFCTGASGPFQETDVAPCVQRNGNYALDVSSTAPVPEPPTWALMLPAVGLLCFAGRQHLS